MQSRARILLGGLIGAMMAQPATVWSQRTARADSSAVTTATLTQRLYAASIAAAEAALRLHETDRAKRWLDAAPAASRGWEWRYLAGAADRSAAVWQVGGTITDLAVSADGALLASASSDGTVRIHDAATGAVRRTLAGHTATAWSPAFSADGARLVTASSDGSAKIWDVATGRELVSVGRNGQGVAAVAWSPDHARIAVASWDRSRERGVWGTITVWNAATGERVHAFEHGDKPIGSIAFTPDGTRLVVGTWDFDLAVFETVTWRKLHELRPPESEDYKALFGLALSRDGGRAAAAYADQRVRIWDLAAGTLATTLYTPSEGLLKALNDVAYVGAHRLATAGSDLTVRLWDVATGRELAVLHGHDRAVNAVIASPDGSRLYSGGADGTVRVWSAQSLEPERSAWRVPHTAYSVAMSPDGRHAVTATWEGWVRVFDATTGREVRAWRGHEQSAVGTAWSADGRWIATTGNDGRIVLWDAATGALHRELDKRDGQVVSVKFSPDGALVAHPGVGGAVVLRRVPAGDSVLALTGGTDRAAGSVAWSPDGASLAAGSSDGVVRVWDARTGALRHRLDLGARGNVALSFHPSGRRLAAAVGRAVKIWDPRDGRELPTVPAPVSSVITLAYSPDGSRIAAGLANNTFELWHGETGEMLLRFPQRAMAYFAAWTGPDTLLLLALDETIRLLRPRAE